MKAEPVKPVAESPSLSSKGEKRLLPISAALGGAKELYLIVSDEDGMSCDWADWIEPKLVIKDGSARDLTGLDWKEASRGSGKVQKGKSNADKELLVGGKVYEKGIGTHAPSTIVFAHPDGVEKFESPVAIKGGGMIRDGKASVRFRIHTEKPPVSATGALDPDAPARTGDMGNSLTGDMGNSY